jgi:transcriptional regulator NrdR family protein
MRNKQITVDLVGCIKCGAVKTVVSDSRTVIKDNIHFTRRKRECLKCDAKYWTKEVIDHPARPHNYSVQQVSGG